MSAQLLRMAGWPHKSHRASRTRRRGCSRRTLERARRRGGVRPPLRRLADKAHTRHGQYEGRRDELDSHTPPRTSPAALPLSAVDRQRCRDSARRAKVQIPAGTPRHSLAEPKSTPPGPPAALTYAQLTTCAGGCARRPRQASADAEITPAERVKASPHPRSSLNSFLITRFSAALPRNI
jgi:hypothetical protein